MPPAINYVKNQGIQFSIHEYSHDPNNNSYGLEAAEKLGLAAAQVFKTLVICMEDDSLAVAILPVANQLSMKSMARAMGKKKAKMADTDRVEKTTGYVLGGVSPLGQKKRLPTILHASAQQFATIYVSAGKRGLEIQLSPKDLLDLTHGKIADIIA